MEWTKANLNNKVRFKMKPMGEQIWLNYWRPYSGDKEPTLPLADAEGWITDQLWCVSAIFGEHFANGFDVPIETEIQIQL